MSEDNKVVAEVREQFGKGAARKIRAAGKIPAVIYGHGTEPKHVALPGHQVTLLIRRANALLDLDIAGKDQLVLVKDVQKDPVRQIIEHIDLIVVKKGEKVQVEVPVHVVGEAAPGTVTMVEMLHIQVEAEATNLPSNVEVSVAGLEAGSHVTGAMLDLPEGVTYLGDPDAVFVIVSEPRVAEDDEAEAGEAAAAPAETPAED